MALAEQFHVPPARSYGGLLVRDLIGFRYVSQVRKQKEEMDEDTRKFYAEKGI